MSRPESTIIPLRAPTRLLQARSGPRCSSCSPRLIMNGPDGPTRRFSNTFLVNDAAILRSASDVRSALLDDNDLAHVAAYFLHQRKFFSRDWWISADNHKRGINVWNESLGRTVLPANTEPSPSGRVHETHPRSQKGAGNKNFHAFHALCILGIVFFRDELLQFFWLTSSQFPPWNRTLALRVLPFLRPSARW